MKIKTKKRIGLITFLILGFSLTIFFILKVFEQNLLFFITPTQIVKKEYPIDRSFRLGGMVLKGSIKTENIKHTFFVTDFSYNIEVKYEGLLPDLFKEGQGVIVTGKFIDNVFIASELLAKHDENYMPPEVAKMMKK